MYNKIRNILTTNFYWIENQDIKEKSNLRGDLKLDSISIINLQILIEDEFHIRFNPMERDLNEIFYSISSLIAYIEEQNNE